MDHLKALWDVHLQCVAFAVSGPPAFWKQAERDVRWSLQNYEDAVERALERLSRVNAAQVNAARRDCERRNGPEP